VDNNVLKQQLARKAFFITTVPYHKCQQSMTSSKLYLALIVIDIPVTCVMCNCRYCPLCSDILFCLPL